MCDSKIYPVLFEITSPTYTDKYKYKKVHQGSIEDLISFWLKQAE